MKLSNSRFLWVVLIIVFIITISELFYLFYYQPPISKKASPPKNISIVPVKPDKMVGLPFVFEKKLDFQNKSSVKEIILEAIKQKRDFVSYKNFLRAVMSDAKDCVGEKYCFQLNNTVKEGWKNDIDNDFPVSISGSFVVKINISGGKDPSGISLNGRLSNINKLWWQGIKDIFIGTGDNGKRLYIDAKSNGPDPFLLFDQTFKNKIEGIYILFNEKGTLFLVTDLAYNKIVFIDLNKATNNKFPEGLFPDKQFYIGYNIAPLSDLKVYDFSIL